MQHHDALFRLIVVRTQLVQMRDSGVITTAEFETANTAIHREEQRLTRETPAAADSVEVRRLFLDAIHGLEARGTISEELVQKLRRGSSRDAQEAVERTATHESGRVGTTATPPRDAPETEDAVDVDPLETVSAAGDGLIEQPLLETAEDLTNLALEVAVDEQEPVREKEIARHAGVADVFRAFLQERNIRWIEAVASLMIVGFAIPLAVTLWQDAHSIGRYLIFVALTLVILGLGWYTRVRLRLSITGKILLTSAFLLIPLDFLALDLLQLHPLVDFIALASLGVVVYLITRLMRVGKARIVAGTYWLLCGLQLTVTPFLTGAWMGFGIATLAGLAFATGLALVSRRSEKANAIGQQEADEIYFVLGALTYGFVLLLARLPFASTELTFSQLSPWIFLVVLPSIFYGHQLLSKADTETEGNARAGGTVILLLAYSVTLVALILASFTPAAMLVTSLLVAVGYGSLASANRKPFAAYITIVAIGISYVSGGSLLIAAVTGDSFRWTPFGWAQMGAAMAPVGFLYWTCGYLLLRAGIRELALPAHRAGVLLAAAISLGSLSDPRIAAYVLPTYAVVTAILALLWRQLLFTYWACAAATVGGTFILYALGVRSFGQYSLLIALAATVFRVLRQMTGKRLTHSQWDRLYRTPLTYSSLAANAIATVVVTVAALRPTTGQAGLVASLLCGALVTANYASYAPIQRRIPVAYLATTTFLGTILAAVYKLGFATHALPVATASVGVLYVALGWRFHRASAHGTARERWAEPLVCSALVAGALAVSGHALLDVDIYTPVTGVLVVGLYFCSTWVYRRRVLTYAACGVLLLTCLAAYHVFDPSVTLPFGKSVIVIAAYSYAALGSGFYLLRRWIPDIENGLQEETQDGKRARTYAYPLMYSGLAASVLLVVGSFSSLPAYAVSAAFVSATLYLWAVKIYPRELWLYPFVIMSTWGGNLWAVKIYPRELWLYPFVIMSTWGVLRLTWALSDWRVLGLALNEFGPLYIVFCAAANGWALLGLAVRRWKDELCARLNLPHQSYEAPFFRASVVMSIGALAVLGALGGQLMVFSSIMRSTGAGLPLICQVLVLLCLFLLLYRSVRPFQVVLLYVAGWAVFQWLLLDVSPQVFFRGAVITVVTALYAAVWYAFVRTGDRARLQLQKLRLALAQEDTSTLLRTAEVTLLTFVHIAVASALYLSLARPTDGPGIATLFIAAAIYFVMGWDKDERAWVYAGIGAATAGGYAAVAAFLPASVDGGLVPACSLLSVCLAYLWAAMGARMDKRYRRRASFAEPCKWAGVALAAGGLATLIAYIPAGMQTTSVFHVSVGLLGFLLGTVFFLRLAWTYQNQLYAYGAQLAVAGAFTFARFTVPYLFDAPLLQRFWPVGIVGISFATYGLSHVLQRLKLTVYARPSYHMSLVLPLIPLVGSWWVGVHTGIETLVATGALYSLFAAIRRQWRYGYIAVTLFSLAVQIALFWKGVRFGVHPQVFIAPIGFTLVGIAHLNRHEFSRRTTRSIRAFAATMIYVSSTTELYTAGGAAPIILAGLCLLGILAGMVLRIRPFLYLGTAFLLWDILMQIYRAGQINSWIWWLAGISSGLIILLLFAWFERRREQVVRLLGTLKDWE